MRKYYSANKIAVLKKRETETWIYSYADLITNLLALFVMLLILTNGSSKTKTDFIRGIEQYVSSKQYATGRLGSGQSELDAMNQIIAKVIQESELSGQVNLARTRTGIELTFDGAIVFPSGTAKINDDAKETLDQVAALAKALPEKYVMLVEGHTDSRPVSSTVFPSNWELSTARAGAVVRYMEGQGFPSKRMRAVGFADTQPLEDDTPDSERNRRVVIKIDKDENAGKR